MSSGPLLYVGALVALLAANAFFVAIEFALVALRPSRIQELIDSGNSHARIVQKLQKNMDLSVSAAQLGITVASIALGLVCEPAVHHFLVWAVGLIAGDGYHIPDGVALAVSLVAMSALHVVIGEQVPKVTALRLPETVALLMCRPFDIYCRVTWPFTKALDWMTGVCLRLVGIQKKAEHESVVHSADELEILFEQSEQAGELHPRETEMLKGVFDLDELSAEQIMVPRARMDCVDRTSSLRDAFAMVSRTKHSRIPVTDGHDRVIGVLYSKDLFDVVHSHMQTVSPAVMVVLPSTQRLEPLIRKVYRVAPTMHAREVLDGMRKRNVQIAIVQDEQQRAVGMVTMEDILERLVGEIRDEHDKITPPPAPAK
jgi:CBS domain containing-hemolysin-like protein